MAWVPSNRKFQMNDELAIEGKATYQQQREWLDRASIWPGLSFSRGWRGVKILGAGSNGIVGLFRNTRPTKMRGQTRPTPTRIAVKQSGPAGALNMLWESRIMEIIDTMGKDGYGGSNHIVKLYRSFHLEGGSGVNALGWDPFGLTQGPGDVRPLGVSRIYIEYCDQGSLVARLGTDDRYNPAGVGDVTREEDIWRIFHCIAKALAFLEHGYEFRGTRAPSHGIPLVNFDIKPENVFIGGDDGQPEEHQRMHVFKLGDFGYALNVPIPNPPVADADNTRWINNSSWRGTPQSFAPEQLYPNHPNRVIGPHTDLWVLGCMMYQIMANGDLFQDHDPWNNITDQNFLFTKTYGFNQIWPANSPRYSTFGEALLEAPFCDNYSQRLIELVHRCLAYDPADRPTIRQVLKIISPTIRAYDAMNTAAAGIDKVPRIVFGGIDPFITPDVDPSRRLDGRLGRTLPPDRRGDNLGGPVPGLVPLDPYPIPATGNYCLSGNATYDIGSIINRMPVPASPAGLNLPWNSVIPPLSMTPVPYPPMPAVPRPQTNLPPDRIFSLRPTRARG